FTQVKNAVEGEMSRVETYPQDLLIDLESLVISIFDQQSLASQPKYLADLRTGDAVLLRRLYELIHEKTLRGKQMERFPLKLICLAVDAANAGEAKEILLGTDHLLESCSSSNVEEIVSKLRESGIQDAEESLPICMLSGNISGDHRQRFDATQFPGR